ncbi:hypothetical protein [Streptomyces sp. MBT62]|uniref:hypothetical protein n=1 Tax=Streptomyces sp. MBT62 TaxID=2800410 RepID=UPI00190A8894|nr:hypothetical protein [Streptomyces sp. MBT62]MBK3565725.1 hypothetical protein [Streptomyces sp. MBT62]
MIVGPRTLDHLETQLPVGDRTLSGELLDRTDEIVAPGTTVKPGDTHAVVPALERANRRR